MRKNDAVVAMHKIKILMATQTECLRMVVAALTEVDPGNPVLSEVGDKLRAVALVYGTGGVDDASPGGV